MLITVKIVPNARKNEVAGFHDGIAKIKIHAVPDKGKANEELVLYLSELLQIPKSCITIISGHTSRIKTIKINTDSIPKNIHLITQNL